MSNLRTIEFCCGGKKCPVITEMADGMFAIGGTKEGVTTWDKDQMKDFVEAAKTGKFDELIAK